MAWLYQSSRDKRKLGSKAPWSVGWLDPETRKQQSKKIGAKSRAERYARKIEGELAAGTYEKPARITWAEFRKRYEEHRRARNRASTLEGDGYAFDHFERLIRPGRLASIKTATIERYVDLRSQERVKSGQTVSPATINEGIAITAGRIPQGRQVGVDH